MWRAAIDLAATDVALLYGLLSSDERERSHRYKFVRDRDRFVAARGTLRAIIAAYLGVGPHLVAFDRGTHGKPELQAERHGSQLRFNVSHSHGLALVAVAAGREVGVDLELMRPEVPTGKLADQFFSEDERAALRSLPLERRRSGFFDCWTRKEAYVKARGLGLSIDLASFSVSVDPRAKPALVEAGRNGGPSRYALRTLAPGPGYAAAVAVEGAVARLSRWTVDGATLVRGLG